MTSLFGMFAKQPVPGRVKTRLAASIGDVRAAELHAAFVGDLIEKHSQTADRRVLAFSPNTASASAWSDATAGECFESWSQSDGDLGHRMQTFFDTAFSTGADRVVLIGSDSPNLPVGHVQQAFDLLGDNDVVLGPALDGGYYIVGQRSESRDLFSGVEWSSDQVFKQTCERIRELDAGLTLLPEWFDVDTVVEARQLQEQLTATNDHMCPRTVRVLNDIFTD